MVPAVPHHRHQSSLEGVIDFSAEEPLQPHRRSEARRKFYRILDHFEVDTSRENLGPYVRPRLIRYTYEYALSEEARDRFLRAFFQAIELPIDGGDDVDPESLRSAVTGFADYLLDNFFLPLKATSRKTPQPTPSYHSAIEKIGKGPAEDFVGTPDRLSALRGACLIRDRHRCVVSRRFDAGEGIRRMRRHGEVRDDDGNLLSEDDKKQLDDLEVAHILPHSLTKTDADGLLSPSKRAALAILNMFDSGIADLIEGPNIDHPRNAITLTSTLQRCFGDFEIYFEATGEPHTYSIGSFLPPGFVLDFPVVRTLHVIENRTIDPPLPRLLAVHRAIAHILHLSAAGAYIDQLLWDLEKYGIRADGSTDLPRLLNLGLGQWLDGAIYT